MWIPKPKPKFCQSVGEPFRPSAGGQAGAARKDRWPAKAPAGRFCGTPAFACQVADVEHQASSAIKPRRRHFGEQQAIGQAAEDALARPSAGSAPSPWRAVDHGASPRSPCRVVKRPILDADFRVRRAACAAQLPPRLGDRLVRDAGPARDLLVGPLPPFGVGEQRRRSPCALSACVRRSPWLALAPAANSTASRWSPSCTSTAISASPACLMRLEPVESVGKPMRRAVEEDDDRREDRARAQRLGVVRNGRGRNSRRGAGTRARR